MPTAREPGKEVRWITENAPRQCGGGGKAKWSWTARPGSISPPRSPKWTMSSSCPGGSSRRWNQVWYGQASYNPDMVRKYLDVFRGVNNFIHTGEDGMTPAMRPGFTNRPLAYADLLWPGEKIPSPRKVRRKGRALKL